MDKKTVGAIKYSGVSGALGGALAVIFVWILTLAKLDVPNEVATSLTVIFSFVINIVLARTGVISETE